MEEAGSQSFGGGFPDARESGRALRDPTSLRGMGDPEAVWRQRQTLIGWWAGLLGQQLRSALWWLEVWPKAKDGLR